MITLHKRDGSKISVDPSDVAELAEIAKGTRVTLKSGAAFDVYEYTNRIGLMIDGVVFGPPDTYRSMQK